MNEARNEDFSDVIQPRIKLESASLKEVKKVTLFLFSVSKDFWDLEKLLTPFQSFVIFRCKLYRMGDTLLENQVEVGSILQCCEIHLGPKWPKHSFSCLCKIHCLIGKIHCSLREIILVKPGVNGTWSNGVCSTCQGTCAKTEE